MTVFCLLSIDLDISLHIALPTTKPSAFFRDLIVFSVIPKPITTFFDLFCFFTQNASSIETWSFGEKKEEHREPNATMGDMARDHRQKISWNKKYRQCVQTIAEKNTCRLRKEFREYCPSRDMQPNKTIVVRNWLISVE